MGSRQLGNGKTGTRKAIEADGRRPRLHKRLFGSQHIRSSPLLPSIPAAKPQGRPRFVVSSPDGAAFRAPNRQLVFPAAEELGFYRSRLLGSISTPRFQAQSSNFRAASLTKTKTYIPYLVRPLSRQAVPDFLASASIDPPGNRKIDLGAVFTSMDPSACIDMTSAASACGRKPVGLVQRDQDSICGVHQLRETKR